MSCMPEDILMSDVIGESEINMKSSLFSDVAPSLEDLAVEWVFPDDEEDFLAAVPQGLSESQLDVIPQPCYPSPSYPSPSYSDPSLSPYHELESMEQSSSLLHSESDLGDIQSVNFADLVDDDYGSVPMLPLDEGADLELQQFLNENSCELNCNDILSDTPNVITKREASPVLSECSDRDSEDGKITDDSTTSNPEPEPRRKIVFTSGNSKQSSSTKVYILKPINSSNTTSASIASKTGPPRNLVSRPARSMCTKKIDLQPEEDVNDKNSKNAIQARVNRQKKKAYIQTLEKDVAELSKDNQKLSSQTGKLKQEKDSLQEEVAYLKSVLSNQSMLSDMLSSITQTTGVRLTTSFSNDRKRKSSEDHDYGRPSKRSTTTQKSAHQSGGLCLHVDNEQVSLEFCSKCARMARGASQSEVS